MTHTRLQCPFKSNDPLVLLISSIMTGIIIQHLRYTYTIKLETHTDWPHMYMASRARDIHTRSTM